LAVSQGGGVTDKDFEGPPEPPPPEPPPPAQLEHAGPSPDFALAGEAPHVTMPAPPVLPSPAEAALKAARIVSAMVDIDSESGAVIAAAAAAGAAIEAANAAKPEGAGHDPMTTVKLSRDRILRA